MEDVLDVVHRIDGIVGICGGLLENVFGLALGAELDEAETTAAAGVAILNHDLPWSAQQRLGSIWDNGRNSRPQ